MLSQIGDFLIGVPGLDWIPGVADHWWHLSLGGKVLEVGRLILEIAGAWELFFHRLYGWLAKRRSHLEKLNEALEDEVQRLKHQLAERRAELDARGKERDEARNRLPEAAMARAEHEWRDRNKSLAIRHLEEWYDANAASIAAIAMHLAKYHLAEAIPTPGDHLTRAAAMIHVARGASGDGLEAREMSIQFQLVNGALQEQLIRDAQIAWNDHVGREPGAMSLIQTLSNVARYCYDRGHWRLAPIFADRAADLAARGGPSLRKMWCEVESFAAYYQSMMGHPAEALVRLDAVLATAERAAMDRDPTALTARYYRAHALFYLGRYVEALSEIEAFAPIEAEVLGARHPNTLATRSLRARTLSNLGRYAEALSEIEAFAPIEAEVLGARHPNTLATRYLRARTLSDLGRNPEALSEIEAFLPIQTAVLGSAHPDHTLRGRSLRARTLFRLGRHAEALSEIDAFAPIELAAVGAGHPHVLNTEALRTEIETAKRDGGKSTDE